MIAGYEGCYSLVLANKDEDSRQLNDAQRAVLNRDYPTFEKARHAKSVIEKQLGIVLEINPTIKTSN